MPTTLNNVYPARTDSQVSAVKELFQEFADSLGIDLCFQGFKEELATLPGKYSPPSGELLLAETSGAAVGCVAFRRLDREVCEMKRLYVRPIARGTGLGRRLASMAMAIARDNGYRAMRLDTLPSMTLATALYRSLGFREIDPYYDNPIPGALYLETEL